MREDILKDAKRKLMMHKLDQEKAQKDRERMEREAKIDEGQREVKSQNEWARGVAKAQPETREPEKQRPIFTRSNKPPVPEPDAAKPQEEKESTGARPRFFNRNKAAGAEPKATVEETKTMPKREGFGAAKIEEKKSEAFAGLRRAPTKDASGVKDDKSGPPKRAGGEWPRGKGKEEGKGMMSRKDTKPKEEKPEKPEKPEKEVDPFSFTEVSDKKRKK